MSEELSEEQMKKIIDDAFIAAKDAESQYVKKFGEPMFCGFAWVVIRPATSRFAKFFKKTYPTRVSKGYPTGISVWNPGDSGTQSMDVKTQGAQAFAAVLQKHGIRAYAESRAD